jgi:hypothetical protein
MVCRSICASFVLATATACGVAAVPPDAGSPERPDSAADVSPTRNNPGSVYEAESVDGGTAPIAGASVCILEHPELPCATTDQAGAYVFVVPSLDDGIVSVDFTADGHLGRVSPAGKSWWPGGTPLYSDASAKELATRAGFAYPDSGTGFIRLRLLDGGSSRGLAGATITLSPASGRGPVYAATPHDPDPSLTATSSSGTVLFGNVAPGRVTLTVSAAGRTCSTEGVTGTWPSSAPNVISVRVAAHSITDDVVLFCR